MYLWPPANLQWPLIGFSKQEANRGWFCHFPPEYRKRGVRERFSPHYPTWHVLCVFDTQENGWHEWSIQSFELPICTLKWRSPQTGFVIRLWWPWELICGLGWRCSLPWRLDLQRRILPAVVSECLMQKFLVIMRSTACLWAGPPCRILPSGCEIQAPWT